MTMAAASDRAANPDATSDQELELLCLQLKNCFGVSSGQSGPIFKPSTLNGAMAAETSSRRSVQQDRKASLSHVHSVSFNGHFHRHKCPSCPMAYMTGTQLDRHRRVKHGVVRRDLTKPKQTKVPCGACGLLVSERNIARHFSRTHRALLREGLSWRDDAREEAVAQGKDTRRARRDRMKMLMEHPLRVISCDG